MAGNPLLRGLAPTHPGEVLREDVAPALDLGPDELARRLGVSADAVQGILETTQPVTPEMALRLGRLFGNSPEFWLNLQRDYDLRTLEPTLARELAAIRPVAA